MKAKRTHPKDKLPIAIILPHAGLEVPPEFEDRLAIGEHDLFNEADVYTDLIFDFQDRVTHWLRFPYARALIDVNRPNDPALLKRAGDGIIKEKTSYGKPIFKPGHEPDEAESQALVQRYWQSWHDQLASIAQDPNIKLVIDAHSMAARGPSNYDPQRNLRPKGCVSNLGDAQGQPRAPHLPTTMRADHLQYLGQEMDQQLQSIPSLCPKEEPGPVILNEPYWGGWDLTAHGTTGQQPWAMIEMSRAMYVGPQEHHTPAQPPNMAQIEQLREAMWEAIASLFWRLEKDL